MPSFDVVSEVDQVELRNAVDQASKEVGNRFDFKGTDARIDLADKLVTIHADAQFQLDQVYDILVARLGKRNVDVRCLERGELQKVSGNKVKQDVTVRVGVGGDLAKKIVKLIKDSKLKLQAGIQGDAVRVSGAKRDTLQEGIALLRREIKDFPLQFNNFRD
ncbi:MAG: YajQ family cyclic di-GMP-binding protein [Rhodocyclaceae bacterium]|nr:YajQ family cyclic di-GMP-binding protein [Rhodocyclaceae bacterium]MBX3669395.1 YajQ family cyclic di-GMP-binding protein [Rhodocyclaceae bacterium]